MTIVLHDLLPWKTGVSVATRPVADDLPFSQLRWVGLQPHLDSCDLPADVLGSYEMGKVGIHQAPAPHVMLPTELPRGPVYTIGILDDAAFLDVWLMPCEWSNGLMETIYPFVAFGLGGIGGLKEKGMRTSVQLLEYAEGENYVAKVPSG